MGRNAQLQLRVLRFGFFHDGDVGRHLSVQTLVPFRQKAILTLLRYR